MSANPLPPNNPKKDDDNASPAQQLPLSAQATAPAAPDQQPTLSAPATAPAAPTQQPTLSAPATAPAAPAQQPTNSTPTMYSVPPTPPPRPPQQPGLPLPQQPRHQNITARENFVNIGSITTSTMSDPINTNNPFQNDFQSSRLYQSLNTPNEDNFRKAIIQRARSVNSVATRNHTQQTSGESGETLISRMLIAGENIVSSTPLRCRSVKATEPKTMNQLGSGRIGLRAVVTSHRLLLVDANKNSVHKIKHAVTPSSVLSPPRPKESFSVETLVSDDVWFKPIPLNCVTGIEILSSHGSEASALVSNNRHPGWFLMLLVGVLGFGTILVSNDDENLVITGFILAVLGFLGSMVFYSFLARSKVYAPRSIVYKERKISLGIYDTISNRPLILELELEDSQNLSTAYDWCRILQQYTPQLSSEKEPLLLL